MSDLPKAVWSGTFKVFGVDVRCHVLDDGRRIVDPEDVAKIFDPDRTDAAEPEELVAMSEWMRGK